MSASPDNRWAVLAFDSIGEVQVDCPEVRIGRQQSPTNEPHRAHQVVNIDGHGVVSRWHCTIHRELDGQVLIEDNGSINGTFVRKGGRELSRVHPKQLVKLHSGDIVRLGTVNPVQFSIEITKIMSFKHLCTVLKDKGFLPNTQRNEDRAIRACFAQVDRRIFVPPGLSDRDSVYGLDWLPGVSFELCSPMFAARVAAELLSGLNPGGSFLQVGGDPGYICAIVATVLRKSSGGIIHSIDIEEEKVKHAEQRFTVWKHSYGTPDVPDPTFRVGDCFALHTDRNIRYDRIFVSSYTPEHTANFFRRMLADGGILVGPFGDQLQKATAQQQTMTPLEVDAADLNNIAPLQQYEQHEKKFTMDDNKEPTPEALAGGWLKVVLKPAEMRLKASADAALAACQRLPPDDVVMKDILKDAEELYKLGSTDWAGDMGASEVLQREARVAQCQDELRRLWGKEDVDPQFLKRKIAERDQELAAYDSCVVNFLHNVQGGKARRRPALSQIKKEYQSILHRLELCDLRGGGPLHTKFHRDTLVDAEEETDDEDVDLDDDTQPLPGALHALDDHGDFGDYYADSDDDEKTNPPAQHTPIVAQPQLDSVEVKSDPSDAGAAKPDPNPIDAQPMEAQQGAYDASSGNRDDDGDELWENPDDDSSDDGADSDAGDGDSGDEDVDVSTKSVPPADENDEQDEIWGGGISSDDSSDSSDSGSDSGSDDDDDDDDDLQSSIANHVPPAIDDSLVLPSSDDEDDDDNNDAAFRGTSSAISAGKAPEPISRATHGSPRNVNTGKRPPAKKCVKLARRDVRDWEELVKSTAKAVRMSTEDAVLALGEYTNKFMTRPLMDVKIQDILLPADSGAPGKSDRFELTQSSLAQAIRRVGEMVAKEKETYDEMTRRVQFPSVTVRNACCELDDHIRSAVRDMSEVLSLAARLDVQSEHRKRRKTNARDDLTKLMDFMNDLKSKERNIKKEKNELEELDDLTRSERKHREVEIKAKISDLAEQRISLFRELTAKIEELVEFLQTERPELLISGCTALEREVLNISPDERGKCERLQELMHNVVTCGLIIDKQSLVDCFDLVYAANGTFKAKTRTDNEACIFRHYSRSVDMDINTLILQAALLHKLHRLHAGIVDVHGVYRERDSSALTYVRLPAYKHGTLKEWTKNESEHLSEATRINTYRAIVRDVISALHCLHQHNVLHCDVSPDKVFVREDHSGVLGDFDCSRDSRGRARHAALKAKETKDDWLAPELELDEEATAACDMYAVGALLCWLHFPSSWPPKIPPDADADAHLMDLIESLTCEEPDKRLTAMEALQHDYFAELKVDRPRWEHVLAEADQLVVETNSKVLQYRSKLQDLKVFQEKTVEEEVQQRRVGGRPSQLLLQQRQLVEESTQRLLEDCQGVLRSASDTSARMELVNTLMSNLLLEETKSSSGAAGFQAPPPYWERNIAVGLPLRVGLSHDRVLYGLLSDAMNSDSKMPGNSPAQPEFDEFVVTGVERIENPYQYHRYALQRQRVASANAAPKWRDAIHGLSIRCHLPELCERLLVQPNEAFLFQGTSATDVPFVAGHGHKKSIGPFGIGVYFSESARRADQDAVAQPWDNAPASFVGGQRQMFLSRVVLGKPARVLKTASVNALGSPVTRPPCVKRCAGPSAATCSHERFDSVVGECGAQLPEFREFAVFDEALCYPELLITYGRRKKK